jgi:hypothetical protein
MKRGDNFHRIAIILKINVINLKYRNYRDYLKRYYCRGSIWRYYYNKFDNIVIRATLLGIEFDLTA